MTLSDFTSDATAQIANLKRWHALVLRIYSSDSFALLNNPMRARVKPHPLMFTMFFLDQALRLLTTGVICDLLRVFMCVCAHVIVFCGAIQHRHAAIVIYAPLTDCLCWCVGGFCVYARGRAQLKQSCILQSTTRSRTSGVVR